MGKSNPFTLFREEIRRKNYSYRTEQSYLSRIKRFVKLYGLQHPKKLGNIHVLEYLNYLANQRHAAASTQNQALSGIIFLNEQVPQINLGTFDHIHRPKPCMSQVFSLVPLYLFTT